MRASNRIFQVQSLIKPLILVVFLLTVPTIYSHTAENQVIRFNSHCKLKRIAPNKVFIYQKSNDGSQQEYLFNDFNADVLLLIYRNVSLCQITLNLSKKYHLDKTECRRQLKMSLNTLEEWEIIERVD
jgi:hypothetical protein